MKELTEKQLDYCRKGGVMYEYVKKCYETGVVTYPRTSMTICHGLTIEIVKDVFGRYSGTLKRGNYYSVAKVLYEIGSERGCQYQEKYSNGKEDNQVSIDFEQEMTIEERIEHFKRILKELESVRYENERKDFEYRLEELKKQYPEFELTYTLTIK